jgi:hypothetical protein
MSMMSWTDRPAMKKQSGHIKKLKPLFVSWRSSLANMGKIAGLTMSVKLA